MTEYRIVRWEDWVKLCETHDIDPYEEIEFGIDKGGGNSDDYYYLGDVPEREEK